MGYSFGPDHINALARIMHQVRWDEQFPEKYDGLSWNLLIESVVDALHSYDSLQHRYDELWERTRNA